MANTKITDLTSGTAAGTDEIPVNKAGADRKVTVASIGLILANPPTSDGDALGTASLMWSDLYLASGAAINFNNGDVTITHSSNTLTAAGASSGYIFDATVKAHSGTAVPAGGTAGAGFTFSSTSNLGVFFGSGAPTLSAAQGSLYLRTDGSDVDDRLYVNTDGSTTWTNVTTAT